MKPSISLQGHSPAVPLDMVLGSIGMYQLSGVLRGIRADGWGFRFLIHEGAFVCAHGGPRGSQPFTRDVVEVAEQALAGESVWGFAPAQVTPVGGPVSIQATLLEVARRSDEAKRG